MIVILSLSLLAFTGALPNGIGQGPSEATFIDTIAAAIRNTVVVPDNCPTGQVVVNGVCRDIWRSSPAKVVPNVKIACPAGYTLVGAECVDWSRNIVTVPSNCPEGQVWVNGACRDIWKAPAKVQPIVTLECPAGYSLVAGECIDWLRNVVTVPNNCPEGQEWVNGACRDIWKSLRVNVEEEPANPSNTITVPENCKPNQQWVNGQCRDIWRSGIPNMIGNQ